MPEEGLQWTPLSEILSFDEIERIVRIAMTCGIRTVRLTGGEPLVRHKLPDLVRKLSQLGLDDLSMTTNGVLLTRHAVALAEAGLQRVNVSLDSLDRHRFALMTRRDQLNDVIEGIEAAAAAGMQPIKVNCVVLRDINETEAPAFAELARTSGVDVRFIEYLPLDADNSWSPGDVVPSAEIISSVEAVHPLIPAPRHDNQPATVFLFADGAPGSVGVIPSVTAPFCASCDRVRMTSDGQFRTCLFSTEEIDLKTLLRSGASDAEIAGAMVGAVAGKQAGHGIGSNVFMRPRRSMSMIGG